jgi:hypothetical protein
MNSGNDTKCIRAVERRAIRLGAVGYTSGSVKELGSEPWKGKNKMSVIPLRGLVKSVLEHGRRVGHLSSVPRPGSALRAAS